MNSGVNFSVPVALQIKSRVARFLDVFTPVTGDIARVLDGINCQYKANGNEITLMLVAQIA